MTATKKRYGPSRHSVVVVRRNEFTFALKTWRKDAGVTQAQLAARLGISTNSLSNVETGHTTPDQIVEGLAGLGFEPAQQMLRVPPPQPEPEPAPEIPDEDVPLGGEIRCRPR